MVGAAPALYLALVEVAHSSTVSVAVAESSEVATEVSSEVMAVEVHVGETP